MCPSPPPVSPPPIWVSPRCLGTGRGAPGTSQPCTLRGRLKNPPFGLRSRNSPSKMLSSFQVRVSLPAVLAEAASSPPEIPKNPQIAALRRKTADVRRTPRARGAAPHPRGALSRHNPPSGGGASPPPCTAPRPLGCGFWGCHGALAFLGFGVTCAAAWGRGCGSLFPFPPSPQPPPRPPRPCPLWGASSWFSGSPQ